MSLITEFRRLNFTLGNEDPWFDRALLPPRAAHALCVAGSGTRVLALLSRGPRRLTVVDAAAEQLLMVRLRLQGARQWSHRQYVSFFGYPGAQCSPARRRELFTELELEPEVARPLQQLLQRERWGSVLYAGPWERRLIRSTAPSRWLTRRLIPRLLRAPDAASRRRVLRQDSALRLRLLAAMPAAATALYRLLAPWANPPRNLGRGYLDYYLAVYRRMLTEPDPRANPFFQLYFFGELRERAAAPPEADPAVYRDIQHALTSCRVELRVGDVLQQVAQLQQPVDFVTLSNVPSFLRGAAARGFLQRLAPRLGAGALVLCRYFVHRPAQLETQGYDDVTAEVSTQHAERTGLWELGIFRRHGAG